MPPTIQNLDLTRDDLATLFCEKGFRTIVEVGTERGKYAEMLCQENPEAHVICIDPWCLISGYREHVTQEQLDGFYKEAQERLAPYNCTFIRGFSLDAVQQFADESIDAVYIDANHDYDHVSADIREWSKKVRKGGIVSGHDYKKQTGVKRAVQELGVDFSIWRGGKSPSWSFVK